MSNIFREFFVKEKPVFTGITRGIGGFGCGGGAGGGSSTPTGMVATGGQISDYPDGSGNIYRAHIFTTSGSLVVSDLGEIASTVDILSVGGGGFGGWNNGPQAGSGGGGGGVHYRTAVPVPATGTYPVTVGDGAINGPSSRGGATSSPLAPFTARGGGSGGRGKGQGGYAGGSGGAGVGHPSGSAGNADGAPGHPGGIDVVSPTDNLHGWGNPGSAPSGSYAGDGSGGGGAGSAGVKHSTEGTNPGDGGNGARYTTAYGPGNVVSYGGGGSGGVHNGPATGSGTESRPAALRGGGGYGSDNPGDSNSTGLMAGHGVAGLGGGGGGGGNGAGRRTAGTGGSGTFIVRYKIGSSQTGTAKATGGAISYYNNRTIHVFKTSGEFENTSGSPLTVEYIAIGGGGQGGTHESTGYGAGGGGAGGVITNIPGMMPSTTAAPVVGPGSPNALTITIGAGGASDDVGRGQPGTNTTITGPGPWSITAYKGGAGGGYNGSSHETGQGGNGSFGSGGGNDGGQSPNPSGTPGQGSNGGSGSTAGGGGGGAGGVGTNGDNNNGGHGGAGVRLPSSYRDPRMATNGGLGFPGPGSTEHWFAGGGGGSAGSSGSYNPRVKGVGGGSGGPYAGAGNGTDQTGSPDPAWHAATNSGSGGGGGTFKGNHGEAVGGNGGSGIVIISYSS